MRPMSPLQTARLRESTIARGLVNLARKHGKEFHVPLRIDTRGEFSLSIRGEGSATTHGACGQCGEALAECFKEVFARTGIESHRGHVRPESGWWRINHFEAEKVVYKSLGWIRTHRQGVNDCRLTFERAGRFVTVEADLKDRGFGEATPSAGREKKAFIEFVSNGQCVKRFEAFATTRRAYFRIAGEIKRYLRTGEID